MFQVLSEDIISSIHANWGRDGPPGIPLYEVVSIFNFYVMNTRDSMLAMSKVFEIYPESDDVEFMDSLKCFIKFYSNTEDSFSDHCREAKKLLEYKSGPNDGKFSSAIFYVAFQLNLPIPLEESWIDSPLWDYHFYCANIFWPKVISTFKLSLSICIVLICKINMLHRSNSKTSALMQSTYLFSCSSTC